ncbi:Uncharacterised protein [Acinetobacter baumannii]|nr:Uncharacterised protein [Acinetobacter baumannii]
MHCYRQYWAQQSNELLSVGESLSQVEVGIGHKA